MTYVTSGDDSERQSEIWRIVNFVTKLSVDLPVKVGHVVNFVENHLLTRQPTPEVLSNTGRLVCAKIKGVRGLWRFPVFDVFYVFFLLTSEY